MEQLATALVRVTPLSRPPLNSVLLVGFSSRCQQALKTAHCVLVSDCPALQITIIKVYSSVLQGMQTAVSCAVRFNAGCVGEYLYKGQDA
jgi:hypothetical protein